jgi:hypothetical protein
MQKLNVTAVVLNKARQVRARGLAEGDVGRDEGQDDGAANVVRFRIWSPSQRLRPYT